MARAGFCSACGTNVWLTPEGSCQHGHGPECITGAYDVDMPTPTPAPAPTTPQAPPYAQPTVQPAYPQPGAQTPQQFVDEFGRPVDQYGNLIPQQPPKKSKTGLIIAIVIAVLLMMCGCGTFLALSIGGLSFGPAKASAQQRSCFANERTFEGAAMSYLADSPDNTYPGDQQTLIDAQFIKSEMTCPAGGSYTIDPDAQTMTCSTHGHY